MLTEEQMNALKKLVLFICKKLKRRRNGRRLDTDSSLKGSRYLKEILERNSAHCPEILRMEKHAIMVLCSHFKSKGWLWYSH